MEDSTPECFKKALEDILNMKEEERAYWGNRAKEKVLELFSMDQVGNKISYFLSTFLNKK